MKKNFRQPGGCLPVIYPAMIYFAAGLTDEDKRYLKKAATIILFPCTSLSLEKALTHHRCTEFTENQGIRIDLQLTRRVKR
jgi:hypothetical protein